MLKLFVVLTAGIALGRLLSGRRLGFVPRAVTATVWLLLFLLLLVPAVAFAVLLFFAGC